VRRKLVTRTVWLRVTRGRIDGLARYAVGRTLAEYGNKDGSNCHPGVDRLATDVSVSRRTVIAALTWLSDHGFITRMSRGARKSGMADVYHLSIPAPLAEVLEIWEEGDGPLWMERPITERRDRYGRRIVLGEACFTPTKEILGEADCTLNQFLGEAQTFLGEADAVLGEACFTPPDLTAPDLIGQGSDALHRRHAPRDASAQAEDQDQAETKALKRAYESEDVEAASSIIAWLVGGYQPDETAMAESILNDGQHPVAVLNTIRKRRNGGSE
jgi:hypothetical protein